MLCLLTASESLFQEPNLIIDLVTTSSPILAAIEEHQAAVFQNRRYRRRCLRCDANRGFKRHELRRRNIRVLVSLTVQVLSIVLARWKCQHCGLIFTDWPDFRTSLPTLRQHQPPALAREYLVHDDRSLQDVVAPHGRVMGYVTPPGQPQSDDRALDRSTLWRFLAFPGTQVTSLQTGLQLLSEREPLSTLHRFLGAVAPHIYRSPQRGEDLRTARRLLHLRDQWDRTFHEPLFPRYATESRGP